MDIIDTMRELDRLKRQLAGYRTNPASKRQKRAKETERRIKLKRDIAKLQTKLRRLEKLEKTKKPKRKKVGRPRKLQKLVYEEYEDFYDTYAGELIERRTVILEETTRTAKKVRRKKYISVKVKRKPGRKQFKVKKSIPYIQHYLDDILVEYDDFLDWEVELAGKTW